MPKTFATHERVSSLLSELKKKNPALAISAEILAENASFLLLLRLNSGLSQTGLEKKLGISKNAYKYECGKIRKMQLKTAMKYLSALNAKIDEKNVFETLSKSVEESKGWFRANKRSARARDAQRKGALAVLANIKKTGQEKEISDFLNEKGIRFFYNKPINGNSVVDFFIPAKKPVVIEAKRLKTENWREQKKQVRELAYQGYKIRFHNKCRLIALIESKNGLGISEKEELQGPFDEVFTDVGALKTEVEQWIQS